MKIVSLIGSYRKDGNTARIVSLMEKRLLALAEKDDIALEIERIQLGSLDIKTCRGCRICFDKGEEKCPLKDDVRTVRDKIAQADGIIAASPVYVEDVTGIMKNWIDRMAFICHRPAFAGKYAYIVTTSGGGETGHAINTMKNAFIAWGATVSGTARFRTGPLTELPDLEARYSGRIGEIAVLFDSIRDSSAFKPSFYSLMAFKIRQKLWSQPQKDTDSFDYKYWHDSGWLEKRCRYYIPYGANPLKMRLARLVGGMVALFFK